MIYFFRYTYGIKIFKNISYLYRKIRGYTTIYVCIERRVLTPFFHHMFIHNKMISMESHKMQSR
ncbi:hypothetical protein Hanom_Chr16g01464511 [Helianthus anomalus]